MIIYDLLYNAYGPQNWWPAESQFEMMIGAILTQNTSWNNAEKAIQNLKKEDSLSIEALRDIPVPALVEHIRPAGYFNIKAKRLKNLIAFIQEKYDGDLNELLSGDT